MSGFHLLPPSWSSGASATSNSDATTSVSAANLLFVQPSRKWRSDGLGTLQVTINAGESRPWDSVFLGYSNGYTGTLRITSNDTTGTLFSTPSFDSDSVDTFDLRFSGNLNSFTHIHTWVSFATTQTYQYVGLEIVDASNPDGFFQAGVVVVGEKFTPRIGADLGSRSGRTDNSTGLRLIGGEKIVRPKRGYDEGLWTFPHQVKSDEIAWRRINRQYGSKIPVVFKWDPITVSSGYEQETIYYGYMQWNKGGAITYTRPSNGGMSDVQVGIEEV